MAVFPYFNKKQYRKHDYLFEKFGIINFDDSLYQNDIKYITDEIYSFITTGKSHIKVHKETLNDDYLGDQYNGDYNVMRFTKVCNINSILFYLQNIDELNDYIIKHNLQAQFIEDVVVMTNDYGKKKGWYVQNGCKTLGITIFILYSKRTITKLKLSGIIEHELKHVFDQNTIYKNNLQLMNKDVIVAAQIENYITNSNILAYNNIINNLNNIQLYSNTNIIYPLFCNLLYYMNKSEISARLAQHKYNQVNDAKNLYMQYEQILNNILEYSSQSFIKFINSNIILKYNLGDVLYKFNINI